MSDTNKTFKADSIIKEPYSYVSAELDLTELPTGTYYFNSENNFEYNKNWFNYTKFATIPENAIIDKVVQYSGPEIIPNQLDTSKNYVLDSTSLNAEWKAKVVPVPFASIVKATDVVSATDSNGNIYICSSWLGGSLDLYDSTNVVVNVINPGVNTTVLQSFVSKYTSSGAYLWTSRLLPGVDTNIAILAVETDSLGNVYVAGTYGYFINVVDPTNGEMTILNSDGTPYYYNPLDPTPLSIPRARGYTTSNFLLDGFLIKYNSLGFVQWATRFKNITTSTNVNQLNGVVLSVISFPLAMSMTIDSINNIYITTQYGSDVFTAYDTPGLLSNISSLPIANNPSNTILIKYDTQGIARWISRLNGDNCSGYGRSISIDSDSNLYITGYYTTIDKIYNASNILSSVIPPPSSLSGIDWVIRESGLNWKSITSNGNGQRLVAVVYGGQIYTSSNGGTSWTPRETNRNWISVASDNSGLNLVAVVYGGQIFTSSDGGVSWTPRETNRNWNFVSSSSSGQRLVACVDAGRIYNSNDFGVSWNVDIVPGVNQNWKSVAMDSSGLNIVAVSSLASKIYYSVDGGANFNILANSPIQTWNGVAISSNGATIVGVVNGGYIYQSSDTGVTWSTRYFAEIQEWNYVYSNNNGTGASGNFIASVDEGLLYISLDNGITWNPINSTRLWTSVSANADFSKLCGTVSGQPIQIGTNNISNINTYLVKYDTNGICQWITYCQGGRNNGTASVFNSKDSSITITGRYDSDLSAYDSDNFGIVSALIPKIVPKGISDFDGFLINYNLDGNILWESKITVNTPLVSGDINGFQLKVDTLGNIHLAGAFNKKAEIYDSDGNLNRTLTALTNSIMNSFLIKYYSNGIVQSATKIEDRFNYATSLTINPLTNQVHLAGYYDRSPEPDTIVYNSDDTVSGISPLTSPPDNSIYLIKYNPTTTPSFIVNPPNYNNPFDIQFTIGGSSRSLIEGYYADQTPEIWGGQTGFIASPVDSVDLNTGVICSYGHELGNTRNFISGFPSTPANVYRCLSVTLSEPSFPINDPQPETPGSVGYGFLPFYIQTPAYATGVVFNTQLYNSSNLIMSATGTVVGGQSFGGLSVGDVIRIIIIDPLSTGRYITLTVKGFFVSDASVLPNIQAAVIFEETTYYVSTEITPISLGLPRQTYTTLLPNKTISAFYKPRLVKQGKLNLILKLYNKYAP